MNSDTEYTFLIAFVIFLAIKNLVAIIVHAKFPTYENLDKASTFWKIIVKNLKIVRMMLQKKLKRKKQIDYYLIKHQETKRKD